MIDRTSPPTASSAGARFTQAPATLETAPPSSFIERRTLTDLLGATPTRTVMLIRAPAGWGKTSLIDQWTRQLLHQNHIVARTIVEADSTVVSLWSTLIDQLCRDDDRLAEALGELGPALSGPNPPSVGEIAVQVGHAVSALDRTATVVLDDLHTMPPAVGRTCGVTELVRHAPANLRIVLAGRAIGGLPVGTWRMAGRLIDIGIPELQLSVPEAAALAQANGLALPADVLERMRNRAEGWIGGFQLLCLAARRRGGGIEPVQAVLDGLPQADDAVAEYLIEQVLDTLDPDTRDFVTVTCRLGDISADLAAALTARTGADADAQLRRIAATTGFVTLVPGDPELFHCHPLLADTLTAWLRRTDPDRFIAASRAAARWLSDRGEVIGSVENAIAAEDWDLAAELYVRGFPRLGGRGQATRLRHLLDRFPPQMVLSNPELAMSAANSRAVAGAIEESERFTAAAIALVDQAPPARQARIRFSAALLEPARARVRGDYPAVVRLTDDLAVRALASSDHSPAEANVLTAMWSNRGTALLWAGDLLQAEDCLRRAIASADISWADLPRLNALAHLPWLDLPFGRLQAAERAALHALTFADSWGWRDTFQAAPAHLALAWIAVEQMDFRAADVALEEAREAWLPFKEHSMGVLMGMVQAVVDLNRGRTGDAAAALASLARDPLTATRGSLVDDYARWVRAAVASAQGGPVVGDLLDSDQPQAAAMRALVVARERLNAGDAIGALDHLRNPDLLDRAQHHHQLQIRLNLWTAYSAHLCGMQPVARRLLARALHTARQEGYQLPFLELGPALDSLTHHLRDLPADLAELGSQIAERVTELRTHAPERAPLDDPLTPREAEILLFLPSRLTTQEIAEQFTVSSATVKTHLSAIYRKLGVSGRRDAAARAQHLGLL